MCGFDEFGNKDNKITKVERNLTTPTTANTFNIVSFSYWIGLVWFEAERSGTKRSEPNVANRTSSIRSKQARCVAN